MSGRPSRIASLRPRADAFALWVVFALVGSFYLWTEVSASYRSICGVEGLTFSAKSDDYYPLLTQGFLHGHLSLDRDPSPEFLKIADPWDPAKTGSLRLPDATYYRGRYYLYFGPAPVFLLFLPCKVLLGRYPSHSVAVLVFSLLGYGANLVLLGALRRRYFPGIGIPWLVAGALVTGFASAVPQMIRRPDVWEVAIACGYFALSAALGALYLAIVRRSRLWLAVASLGFGLAIASRPTLLFCPAALLFGMAAIGPGGGNRTGIWARLGRSALAALGPVAACLLVLFAYNFERFGNPLEFGQRYQMHARDERHTPSMSPRFVPFNLRVYFLCPPRPSPRFPFVDGIDVPDLPRGQLGFEDVYGLLPTMPALLAGLALLGLLRRSAPERYQGLGPFAASAAVAAAASCGLILLFAGACNRYQVDFAPYLALLAAVGILWVVDLRRGPTRAWAATRAVLALACAATVILSGLVSIEHNRILRTNNVPEWRRLSRVANFIPFVIDRATGLKSGPVEIKLSFPGRDSGSEVLVRSGHRGAYDTLSVIYSGAGLIRLGLDHQGFGGPVSDVIAVGGKAPHTLVLDLGALYPDYDFRYYAGKPAPTTEALRMRLYATLDGRTVFNRSAAFAEPNVADTRWGWQDPIDPGSRFSGTVSGLRWLGPPLKLEPAQSVGPWTLDVTFPQGRSHRRDPLLSTGRPGRADILFVEYLDGRHLRFALDHWNEGVRQWPPVELDYGKAHRLTLRIDHLADGGVPRSVRVDLDGRTLVDEAADLYPVTAEEVYVGYAPYLNSSCGLEFSGTLRTVPAP